MPNKAFAGRRPRSAGSRVNSQAVWIEVGNPAAGSVGTRFNGEPAERILRGFELQGPLLVVREFIKQPAANTLLLVRRKRRQLRDRGVQRAGHDSSIADGSRMGDRACPECVQNVGGFLETKENSGGPREDCKSLRNKPLMPEVARHHQLENTR